MIRIFECLVGQNLVWFFILKIILKFGRVASKYQQEWLKCFYILTQIIVENYFEDEDGFKLAAGYPPAKLLRRSLGVSDNWNQKIDKLRCTCTMSVINSCLQLLAIYHLESLWKKWFSCFIDWSQSVSIKEPTDHQSGQNISKYFHILSRKSKQNQTRQKLSNVIDNWEKASCPQLSILNFPIYCKHSNSTSANRSSQR